MAKNKKVTEEFGNAGEACGVEQEVAYPFTAVGIGRDPETQRWVLVEIPYSLFHNKVGQLKTHIADGDRMTVIEKFKIKTIELDIIG